MLKRNSGFIIGCVVAAGASFFAADVVMSDQVTLKLPSEEAATENDSERQLAPEMTEKHTYETDPFTVTADGTVVKGVETESPKQSEKETEQLQTDADGNVLDVNTDQISSVTEEQAAQYAGQIRDTAGKIDEYKYEVKQLGAERLIFFMDTSNQLSVFLMVFSVSATIAFVCWLVVLLFVIALSGRVVRPVLAGMEKQKQFITNAGHELKTPLAIIQSNNDAATLIHGETKYSKNIRLQTQRLNVLMTNLLTLAKLDEEVRLPTQTVDVSELILAMLPAYEEGMAGKRISVCADIQPGILIKVHRDTFSQMISIILDNAVKYTPQGGTISIFARERGGQIEITQENSCDLPRDFDPEQLFERFYRGDNARTQGNPSSGYGIGLSAARAIAQAFGGRLTASRTDEGKIRFTARF